MKSLLDTAAIFTAERKELRRYLRFIYSTGETINASDGGVCICFETSQYPLGYYLPEGLQVILEDRYPDIDRVLSNFERRAEEVDLKDGKPCEVNGIKYLHYEGRNYSSHFSEWYIKKIKRLGKGITTKVVTNETNSSIWQVMLFSGVLVEKYDRTPFKGVLMPVRI